MTTLLRDGLQGLGRSGLSRPCLRYKDERGNSDGRSLHATGLGREGEIPACAGTVNLGLFLDKPSFPRPRHFEGSEEFNLHANNSLTDP